jgi:prepilin-type N-terminal cleavage/methylation domain-containing protein
MKERNKVTKKGFTLLEMVIVVGVISILATVAITNYQSHQLRAKDKEAVSILRGLVQAQKQFYSDAGCYAWVMPTSGKMPPGPQKKQWQGQRPGAYIGWGRQCIAQWGAYLSFAQLGFKPTSNLVYFIYYCGADLLKTGPAFACVASGDLDGDGAINRWVYCSQKGILGMDCETGEYKKWKAGVF